MSNAINDLAYLCRIMVERELEVQAAEEKLRRCKESLREVVEEDIPLMFTEMGVEKIQLEDGSSVTVKDSVHASISADREAAAYAWLEERGYDGIIKSVVSISFGKDEIEKAKDLIAQLREKGFEPEMSRKIHSSTLTSFLRERLRAADDIPLETFGAHQIRKASIKAPRR